MAKKEQVTSSTIQQSKQSSIIQATPVPWLMEVFIYTYMYLCNYIVNSWGGAATVSDTLV